MLYIYICYIYVVYMYIYHPILSISKLMKLQVVEIQDLSLKAALPTSLRTKPGERGRWEPGEMLVTLKLENVEGRGKTH